MVSLHIIITIASSVIFTITPVISLLGIKDQIMRRLGTESYFHRNQENRGYELRDHSKDDTHTHKHYC